MYCFFLFLVMKPWMVVMMEVGFHRVSLIYGLIFLYFQASLVDLTPVSGLDVLVRLRAPEELCCGAEAPTLTLGCCAGGGETACGGRVGGRL